jgi:2-polyprenyl-3-methyl-5-hydroxy-6-metoxy-1,4-benzoquinol methylase
MPSVASGPEPLPSCAAAGHVLREIPDVVGRDRQFDLDGTFAVHRCLTCGVAGTSPRLDGEALARHYPADYAPYAAVPDGGGGGLRARVGGAIDRARERLLMRFGPFAPLRRHAAGALLDVGCGRGLLGRWFTARGWRVSGIEPSAQAATVAGEQGIDVHVGTLDDHPFPEAAFDVVTFNHALEHVPDPVAALREAGRLVRPGGSIIASVPNYGGWQRRRLGTHWFHLDLPRHLQHFDRASIATVAADAGLEVVSVRTTSSMTGLSGSLVYRRHGDLSGATPDRLLRLSYLTLPAVLLGDLVLGEGDSLHLVARRPAA